MDFARWDPFQDLITIQHPLERLTSSSPQGWAPAVDLCETETAFVLTAELPGLSREQIKIEVTEGRLTLQGRRDARVSCQQYHQVKRGHGEFRRTVALPHPVDVDQVTAELAAGVLTVTVPKIAPAGPQLVPIT